MSYLLFRDRHRQAALHVTEHTPLGERIDALAYVTDDGAMLSIDLPDDALATLSTGEQALWYFLASLAGAGQVDLAELYATVDADCALAVVWAQGIDIGRFSEMSPVTFLGRAS